MQTNVVIEHRSAVTSKGWREGGYKGIMRKLGGLVYLNCGDDFMCFWVRNIL